jgi:hypothetical protein
MTTDAAATSAPGIVSLVPAAGTDDASRFTVLRDGLPVGRLELTAHGASLRMTGDVRPGSRGAGVATAAVRCACDVVRRGVPPGATRTLEAVVPAAEGAAQRVLEANGFTCADVTGDPLVFARTIVGAAPAGGHAG